MGDTIDYQGSGRGRQAFPRDKAALLQAQDGDEMFRLARQALENAAKYVPFYRQIADRSPDKFVRSFGILGYDLQFYKSDREYFLYRRWPDFGASFERVKAELDRAKARTFDPGKTSFTDLELAQLAIAYNAGRYDPSKGLKQGYVGPDSRYYGEIIFDYLRLVKRISPT